MQQDPRGPLAKQAPPTTITSANEEVKDVLVQDMRSKRRGAYAKFTTAQKGKIGSKQQSMVWLPRFGSLRRSTQASSRAVFTRGRKLTLQKSQNSGGKELRIHREEAAGKEEGSTPSVRRGAWNASQGVSDCPPRKWCGFVNTAIAIGYAGPYAGGVQGVQSNPLKFY